jgi:hypothetical protein
MVWKLVRKLLRIIPKGKSVEADVSAYMVAGLQSERIKPVLDVADLLGS